MSEAHNYDADEILARARADRDSDWPYRLISNLADAPLVPEEMLAQPRLPAVGASGVELWPSAVRVLLAASFGLTNEMIADVYGISIETVKTEVQQALLALRAKNRTHAVALAFREGLIK